MKKTMMFVAVMALCGTLRAAETKAPPAEAKAPAAAPRAKAVKPEPTTLENLQAAFSGETNAKAIEALGGTPKAKMKMLAVKTTKENLKEAIKGENHESKKMYPAFAKKAEEDKNTLALYSFKGAMAAEKAHAGIFTKALENMKDWKAKKQFLVCQTCGYTTMDMTLKVCPVCSQPREQFTQVE